MDDFDPQPIQQLLDEGDARRRDVLAGLVTWGPWRFEPATNVLVLYGTYREGGRETWRYEVDMDRCKTPTQAMAWIAQVASKNPDWMKPEAIGHLVLALCDLLNIQTLKID